MSFSENRGWNIFCQQLQEPSNLTDFRKFELASKYLQPGVSSQGYKLGFNGKEN